ncbi:ATP-binding cassette domain-containing protein [Nonomuraea basaltis]|uniref:ATP-binding cassette domain-containing protein n=1 Tax=Nonomuraea basaltis TaxID=2495887 RepID=UPI00110C514B|nr:ATP-binding cassette domain-containing protein [Nonomuraea basaltis]TMR98824.1 ATP-binding cassette domain-containing protein [Nonomuraea basaltis]
MIHARGLTRVFKVKKETVEAVRGIDLDIEAGQLVAFLGPNGAGKSTTLRILTTLLPPTSGTATVAGHDVVKDPAGVRSRIGYVGQRNSAGEGFLARDELVTQGRCYGLPAKEAAARADELLGLLHLEPLAKRRPGTLSGGQRRRLDIALGLVHRPDLLFLDEPSTGLDPKSRAEIWEHILRLREAYGTTLFLTTHYLEEADSMAERVVIIDNGRIIADGTSEQLKNDLAGDHITITTSTEEEARRAAGMGNGTAEGTTVRLRVSNAAAALPDYLRTLDGAGIKVTTAETTRPTLDDVFLSLTGRSLTDDNIPA